MGLLPFETIDPPQPLAALPARLEQSSPRTKTVLSLVLLALAGLAIVTPFVAVTLHLIEAPAARDLMSGQPGSVLQLSFALAVWTALLGWPAKRLAQRLSARRIVTLSTGAVSVDEQGMLGSHSWSVPLPITFARHSPGYGTSSFWCTTIRRVPCCSPSRRAFHKLKSIGSAICWVRKKSRRACFTSGRSPVRLQPSRPSNRKLHNSLPCDAYQPRRSAPLTPPTRRACVLPGS